MKDSNRELTVAIERARAGDPRGFDALFRTLGAPVVGYLRARGVRDPDGVANDLFVRAFRNIHTFQGDGGVSAFGDARFLGSGTSRPHAGSATGIASRPDGRGYWIATDT